MAKSEEIRFYGQYKKSVFNTLWLSYKPFFGRVLFSLIIGLLGRIILLANTNIIGLWVDSFCQPQLQICNELPKDSSKNLVLLLLVMVFIGFILTLSYRVIFSRLSAHAVSRLYDETTYRTSQFPMSFFDTNPAGRIITRFSSDYGNVFRLFGGPLAEFFGIIFDLIAMIILIGIASPYYLPIVFVIATCNYFIYKINQKKLRRLRRDFSAARSPSISHFAETAQGANTIRSFGKQNSFFNRFKKFDSYYLNQKLKALKGMSFFSIQMNLLTAFLFLITGWIAWGLLNKNLLSIGSIGVAFGFIALSGNTIQMFFEWMSQFEEGLVGVERLDDYIRMNLEPAAKLPEKTQFKTNQPQYKLGEEERLVQSDLLKLPNATVEFKNVWLRYQPDLPAVLKGVSFKIQAGERFGIIGRTGSGKSSLIQALFNLYPLEQGEILVAGQSPIFSSTAVSQIDLNLYRRMLSFISQDPVLFTGSLRNNLDAERNLKNEDIYKVLDQVGLHEWANSSSLNKTIEERGRNLSLGERQLICMARCLLQASPVVIMDEATSSIDPHSEELLVKATEHFFRGRTQIIIAHRLSTLRNCDHILWLEHGKVKMIDSAHKILATFDHQESYHV